MEADFDIVDPIFGELKFHKVLGWIGKVPPTNEITVIFDTETGDQIKSISQGVLKEVANTQYYIDAVINEICPSYKDCFSEAQLRSDLKLSSVAASIDDNGDARYDLLFKTSLLGGHSIEVTNAKGVIREIVVVG